MRFFFYGTLIDADVRAHVLRDLAPAAVEPATLPGWRRYAAKGVTFPIARADPKGSIDGVLARGLSAEAGRRLDAYEGPGYRRMKVDVTVDGKVVSAVLYVDDGSGTLTAAPGEWSYAIWARRHKKAFMAALARQPFAPR